MKQVGKRMMKKFDEMSEELRNCRMGSELEETLIGQLIRLYEAYDVYAEDYNERYEDDGHHIAAEMNPSVGTDLPYESYQQRA